MEQKQQERLGEYRRKIAAGRGLLAREWADLGRLVDQEKRDAKERGVDRMAALACIRNEE